MGVQQMEESFGASFPIVSLVAFISCSYFEGIEGGQRYTQYTEYYN
jgi:hypothetical protein